MGSRRTAKVMGAVMAFGSVIVPGTAVLGTAHSASAADQPAREAMVGRVREESPLGGFAGVGSVLAFGLLVVGAGVAGGRRVWAFDGLDEDDD